MLVFSRFLGYFTEVAQSGSIRRAAEQLHVSASAIDRQILFAEEEFGLPLFERLPTGMRLTEAGELLLQSAGAWQQDFRRVRGHMAELLGLRRGHVRIAVIEALAKGFIPTAIKELRRKYPGITFEVKVLDNLAVLENLVNGDADIGLLLDPPGAKNLIIRAHLKVFVGFVTPKGHALGQLKKCHFNQSENYPIVVPSAPLELYGQVRTLETTTGTRLNIAAATNNIEMIKSLVRQQVGVGILSELDVLQELAEGEFKFTRISDSVLKPMKLALCVMKTRQLSLSANLLLSRLEKDVQRDGEVFSRNVNKTP